MLKLTTNDTDKGMKRVMSKVLNRIKVEDIIIANQTLKDVIVKTPLQLNQVLSDRYQAKIYLKREDLQVVRSFKIRGAYHTIQSLSKEEQAKGVVCASAGNHAQGVAYSCSYLGINGKIFMPTTTPRQKVQQVKDYGGSYVEVILIGDTFDDAYHKAIDSCEQEKMSFVHPFDDYRTITGQGTIGLEIMNDIHQKLDYVFVSIGGGGLAAGVSSYIKSIQPHCKIIGVEPLGAAAMKASIEQNKLITLSKIDKFVDGAAVQQVGAQTFEICRDFIDDVVVVPEGQVCSKILELYNKNAMVVEPAGALPFAALDLYQEQIRGKNVVCIVSGGNNDIDRMQEIKERSMIYEGLLHYFIVKFPQRAGALREFVAQVLGESDDITRFEYTKKNNKESGPALVGVELKYKEDYDPLIERMEQRGIHYIEITDDPYLFNFFI